MFVYGDITTDARVQRAANSLVNKYDVTVVSVNVHKAVGSFLFKNVVLNCDCKFHFLKYFIFIFKSLQYLLKNDFVLLYGHDYYSALLLRIAFCLPHRKFRILYDAHELIIPEENSEQERRMQFFFKWEKSIIKRVDLLLCASDERGNLMRDYYGLDKPPVVIRNISQLCISSDEETKGIIDSLSDFFSHKGKTVVYAGVVTSSREIIRLLQACIDLAPQYKLLIVGNGDSVAPMKMLSNKHPELVVEFTGAVPYKSLGAILSRCDIGYIYYPVNTLNNIYCASNKLYEYASVNLPILANKNPTISNSLLVNDLGVSCEDFVKGIIEVDSKLDTYRENCKLFTKHNSWNSESQKLQNAVNEVLSQ